MVPKLRFAGFNDPWSETSLGSVSSFITSGSRDWAQYYSDCGDKFIRMTNLVRDGITLNLSDLKFVRLPENSNEGKRTALQHHDILISITAELGKLGWVPDDLGTAYINQHIALVRPNLSIASSKFIANLLSTKKYNNILNQQNDAGAKSGLNLSTIKNFEFYAPNKIEQIKISDFLSSIDEKITLLNTQYEQLCQYKKGILQKIFSQNLRFKDSDGKCFPKWENKKIGSIISEYKCKTTREDEWPVMTSSRSGLVLQKEYYGDNRLTERSSVGFNIIPRGYLTYRSRSDDGLFFFNQNRSNTTGCISVYYPVFKFKYGDNYFYTTMFNYYKNLFRAYAVGSSQLVLSITDLKEMKFKIPSSDEQIKISKFLSSIDKRIDNAKSRLDKLKSWKQGLLQKMFV